MESLVEQTVEAISDDVITEEEDTINPSFDNGFPYWEKGTINWRLYVQPGIFGAAETKEAAYEQTKRVIDFHKLNSPITDF